MTHTHNVLCNTDLDRDPVTESGWPDLAYTEFPPDTREFLSDPGAPAVPASWLPVSLLYSWEMSCSSVW